VSRALTNRLARSLARSSPAARLRTPKTEKLRPVTLTTERSPRASLRDDCNAARRRAFEQPLRPSCDRRARCGPNGIHCAATFR